MRVSLLGPSIATDGHARKWESTRSCVGDRRVYLIVDKFSLLIAIIIIYIGSVHGLFRVGTLDGVG